MNIDDFQKHALKSVAITDKSTLALTHRTWGLVGASGILANELKKVIRDKNGQATAEDIELVRKRLGDALYYIAVLAEFYDLKLSEIAQQNMDQSTDFKSKRTTGNKPTTD